MIFFFSLLAFCCGIRGLEHDGVCRHGKLINSTVVTVTPLHCAVLSLIISQLKQMLQERPGNPVPDDSLFNSVIICFQPASPPDKSFTHTVSEKDRALLGVRGTSRTRI